MPTRHRNSKSHKKSLRNKGQKGGAKLEKNNKKITKTIEKIEDLDGATYTQDLMNKHRYTIYVFDSMTYDDFSNNLGGDNITKIITYSKDKSQIFTPDPFTIHETPISGFALLWVFPQEEKMKLLNKDITLPIEFYDNPIEIKLPEHAKSNNPQSGSLSDERTQFVLFINQHIFVGYTYSDTNDKDSFRIAKHDTKSNIDKSKIIEYYNKKLKPIATTANIVKSSVSAVTDAAKNVMSADLTGACNRCTYTFTDAEQKQVLALFGEKPGPTFSANLSFGDGGKLTLAN
jgi:hypothetical protein